MSSDLLNLLGPLFIGIILVWALMGSILIQVYDYHNKVRQTDMISIQVLVYTVFMIEIVHTFMITHSIWAMLVESWGDINGVIHAPWSSSTTPLLNGIVATQVQSFFAWRIHRLWTSRVGQGIAVVIIVISLLQLGAATATTVEYVKLARDTSKLVDLNVVADLWLVSSFVGDAIIAAAMVFVLRRARNQSAFRGTETLLNRLIINTIETGAITAGLALITLILYKLYPTNFLFLTTEFILGKMYSNVLFATLNGRNRSEHAHHNAMSNFGTMNLGTEMQTFPATRIGGSRNTGPESGVVISTTVDQRVDRVISHAQLQSDVHGEMIKHDDSIYSRGKAML
ncbi:hypothetical protein C8R47DRAFT_1322271 [Mycena vitilis]|nr:hypothetical protein C8R47DRAFT_1322271 [Mycena vitilis]